MTTPVSAPLEIAIDSRSADQAAISLDNMVAAGGRAEQAAAALAGESRAAMAGLQGISGAIADFDSRASRLKASVDPLGASMDRINAEMREADALYKVGAIGAAEYANGMDVLESRLMTAVTAQNALTSAQMRGGKAAGFTAGETLNLSRQFADVGVMAAMGMNPLMILIQQGPQIADIFGTAASRGNSFATSMIGVGKQLGIVTGTTTAAAAATLAQAEAANLAAQAELRLAVANAAAGGGAEAAALAATQAAAANTAMAEAATAAAAAETVALAPLALILAGIAAAVALVAGGFAIMAHEMNEGGESADELQKRLGLTDEQMKKVGNTSITMGDTIVGSAQVAGKYLWEAFGPTLTKIGATIKDVFEASIDYVVAFARNTVGTIAAAYGGITAVWSQLPSAIGDVVITTANAVIAGIEGMINGAIDLINDLRDAANLVAMATGSAIRIPELDHVAINRLTNQYAGAGRDAALAYAAGAKEKSAAALAVFDGIGAEIKAASSAARDARVVKEATKGDKPAKAAKDAASALSDEAKEYERVLKSATDAAEAMEVEAKVRSELNYLIGQGLMTQAEATRALELEKITRPILVEAMKVEGEERQKLLDLIERITKAQKDLTGANLEAQMGTAIAGREQQIELLRTELDLVGKTNRERADGLAVAREEQAWKAKGYDPTTATPEQAATYQAAIDGARAVADAQADLREAQAAYNDSLYETLDILADIDAQAQDAAAGMAKAFGSVGKALGDVLKTMTGYAAKQEELRVRRKAEGVTAQEVAKIDREAARDRVAYYGDMIGAAQGFFEEGSNGWKALQAAEQVYRAWEFAMSVRAMIQKATETSVKVASDAAGAASHAAAGAVVVATDATTTATGIAAGAARIFAALGPFGFPVVAAMLAVMAGLGSAGGSSSSPSIPISERRQKEQGTGTVLGDASAKSDSIAKSLEVVASNTNRDLEYSNDMLRALRSIDDQIGAVAAAVARSLNASGVLDTTGLKLGTTGTAPSLSNLGFGSTTTKSLKDQGLTFSGQSLSDILAQGIDGAIYQVIQTTKKSTALGLTYSSSTSTKTKMTDIDAALAEQFTRIIASLKDGVVAAAGILGVASADSVLSTFKVEIGKISFKDMTGSEIEEALNAVFSKLGDEMAAAAVPTLKEVQKVGEGLFETLNRVARQYQVVDVTLSSIGKAFGLVGIASLTARERLVDLFGSLDDFTEQTAYYAENYLTEAERLLPIQNAVTAELARLGLTSVKTRDQFKAVVQGIDVTTQAGAELFAAMMSLAPAFAAVTEETKAISTARDALSGAYDRESSALADTMDRFKGFADGLKAFRTQLYSGPTAALSPEAQYAASKAEFARVAALASSGNEDALGQLQSVSEAYLNASKAYYASSAGYFTDLAAVRDAVTAAEAVATAQVDVAQLQLDALKTQVSTLIDIDQHVVTVAEAIAALNGLLGGGPAGQLPATATGSGGSAANDNAAMIEQLRQLNESQARTNQTLQASLEQQAAISAANQARLQAIEEQLAKQTREMQA